MGAAMQAAADAAKAAQALADRGDAAAAGAGGDGDPTLGKRVGALEGRLDGLTGLRELRGQVEDHSKRLAEIFTRKASKEAVDVVRAGRLPVRCSGGKCGTSPCVDGSVRSSMRRGAVAATA
jgi:hypothetical protein